MNTLQRRWIFACWLAMPLCWGCAGSQRLLPVRISWASQESETQQVDAADATEREQQLAQNARATDRRNSSLQRPVRESEMPEEEDPTRLAELRLLHQLQGMTNDPEIEALVHRRLSGSTASDESLQTTAANVIANSSPTNSSTQDTRIATTRSSEVQLITPPSSLEANTAASLNPAHSPLNSNPPVIQTNFETTAGASWPERAQGLSEAGYPVATVAGEVESSPSSTLPSPQAVAHTLSAPPTSSRPITDAPLSASIGAQSQSQVPSQPQNNSADASSMTEPVLAGTPVNLATATPSHDSVASLPDHLQPIETGSDTTWSEQVNLAYDQLAQTLAREEGKLPPALRDQMEIRLRLLALAAGNRDQAIRTIESLDPALRDYWKEQLFAVWTLIEPNDIDFDSNFQFGDRKRLALALDHLREAERGLAGSAALRVHRVALCDEVRGFGNFHEFPRTTFEHGQAFVVYCEVENFSTQRQRGTGISGEVFATEFQASIVLFDSNRKMVKQIDYAPIVDEALHQRRDMYLHFTVSVPDDLAPGHYYLGIVLEDSLAQKSANSAPIEFEVR